MRYGFIAAGVLAASVFAVTSVQAAGAPRIGVVNLQEVIAKSQAGQQANKTLQPIAEKIQQDISDRRQKLVVLKQQLDKADKKASNYQQLLTSYEDSLSDYQQFVAMNQETFNANRQQLLKPIEQELGQVLSEYGKAHHYDVILSENALGAVYASNAYNITPQITAALDQGWAQAQKAQAGKKPSGGGQ